MRTEDKVSGKLNLYIDTYKHLGRVGNWLNIEHPAI